jgi:uncharacterized protein (TIGR00369 family)
VSARPWQTREEFIAWFTARDGIGQVLGFRLVALGDDFCEYEYTVNPQHLNPNGILHGGALFTAMDSSQGAFVCWTLDPAFRFAATGTATVKYLAPVTEGTIRIRTTLTGRERRKIFVHTVATDAAGREVAVMDQIWVAVV